MKTNNIKTKKMMVLSIVLITLLVISCNKNDALTNRIYLDKITGSYSGEFTSTTLQSNVQGTAVVTKTVNDEIQIHCFGEIMDTTMVMDAFENNDSIMLCNTGEEFYHEYGHMGNSYHMMDMEMGENEWMHHLNNDHQAGDQHYGDFDMIHHTFEFSFKMKEGDTSYMLHFQGKKN